MANSDDDQPVKFVWKIENFSCIKNGALQSPHFPWYSTTWEIIIHFPDETEDNDSFKVELHQLQVKCESFTCYFGLLDSQGFPLVWKQERNTDVQHHYCNLIKRSEIFGLKRNEFLPNDILTVQCHIWRVRHPFIETVPLMALTRIARLVTKKSFTWEVSDVMSKMEKCGLIEPEREESMTIDNSSFNIQMNLIGPGREGILKLSLRFSHIHLRVTISVLDISGKKIELLSRDLPPRPYYYLGILTDHMLMCYRSSFVCIDRLTLHFSFTGMLPGKITFNSLVDKYKMFHSVLLSVNVSHIYEYNKCSDESGIETPNRLNNSDTVLKAIQSMYDDEFLSDFNLKVGDRLFPVHKAVLGMRSPVFRAMFTAEMKEKKDNCSVIKDVDGDTLHRMLQFIYSDKLRGGMDWESASSLYEAADKYALETLKQRCSTILRSGLCADSVLDVLSLADLHRDQELKSSAFEFISLDDNEIVGSERWNKFEEENKVLAFDTLRSVHLHFKNRNKKLCVRT